jgi:hypothetical protein
MDRRFLIGIVLLLALLTGACSASQPLLVSPPVEAPPVEATATSALLGRLLCKTMCYSYTRSRLESYR